MADMTVTVRNWHSYKRAGKPSVFRCWYQWSVSGGKDAPYDPAVHVYVTDDDNRIMSVEWTGEQELRRLRALIDQALGEGK